MAQPYKSEILPHWRFKTIEEAQISSRKIYKMFLQYLYNREFVGADMARKYLQMGFTRARRYANHRSGKKYGRDSEVMPQERDWETSQKAEAAQIFKVLYDKVRKNNKYLKLKEEHKRLYNTKVMKDKN